MAILADKHTRVIVQGITGREGGTHTGEMLAYGTNIVGGVTPSKGGEWIHGKPIFDSVQTAVNATGATASVIFVPPHQAPDAIFEAIDAELELIVCITEGIPLYDMLRIKAYLKHRKTRLIGPNSPGILIPGQTKLGVIPSHISLQGNVGILSRSGTLTYEVIHHLTKSDIGVSACVGIGGDPLKGMSFIELLDLFENDPVTEKLILIGEIGGHDEVLAAEHIAKRITKPVVAFIAGAFAPYGIRMGHYGAIITDENSTALHKIESLRGAGVRVVASPDQIPTSLV